VNFPGDEGLVGQVAEVDIERALSNSLLGGGATVRGMSPDKKPRLAILT
jgi:hypothetical protein